MITERSCCLVSMTCEEGLNKQLSNLRTAIAHSYSQGTWQLCEAREGGSGGLHEWLPHLQYHPAPEQTQRYGPIFTRVP
jgi:hypothetical protein